MGLWGWGGGFAVGLDSLCLGFHLSCLSLVFLVARGSPNWLVMRAWTTKISGNRFSTCSSVLLCFDSRFPAESRQVRSVSSVRSG